MKVVKPTTIVDAKFVSSGVPETDYAAWNAATSYTVGTKVLRTTTHRIYENLIAGVDATLPELATSGVTPRWLDIGPTNRWAMFDQVVDTATVGIATTLTVVLTPGVINSVALVGLTNVASVRVLLQDGATTVYDQTQSLDGTIITDWYEYFFEPYDTGSEALFTDVHPYGTGTLTVTFTASSGVPTVGGLIVGNAYEIGTAEYGASAGIIDYSYKNTDAFGRTVIVKRTYSKRMTVRLFLYNASLRRVQTLLADLRSTPCVWVGVPTNTVTYSPLVVFGFYKDFSLDIAYSQVSYCNLEIEGMI